MHATLELLDQILQTANASQAARHLDIHPSTLAYARKRGRLSPTLAGAFAQQLGKDVGLWVALAALEAEPPGPVRDGLLDVVRGALQDAQSTHVSKRRGGADSG